MTELQVQSEDLFPSLPSSTKDTPVMSSYVSMTSSKAPTLSFSYSKALSAPAPIFLNSQQKSYNASNAGYQLFFILTDIPHLHHHCPLLLPCYLRLLLDILRVKVLPKLVVVTIR